MTSTTESAEITHLTSGALLTGLLLAGKGFNWSCQSPGSPPTPTPHRQARFNEESSLISHILMPRFLLPFNPNTSEKCFPSWQNKRAETEETEIDVKCEHAFEWQWLTVERPIKTAMCKHTHSNMKSYFTLRSCGGLIRPFVTISGKEAKTQNW